VPQGASRPLGHLLCWPQTVIELLQFPFLNIPTHFSSGNGLQRYDLFYYWQ